MRAAMVYQKISMLVRPLSKLPSLEPSVVICIVATFGMILGRVLKKINCWLLSLI